MKKSIWSLGVVLMVFFACEKKTSEEGLAIGAPIQKDGVVYSLDTSSSRIEWKGYKVLKTEQTAHLGTLNFKEGMLTVKDGALQYGVFHADMNSLKNVDLKGNITMKSKLEEHLKSEDFFDAAHYPKASFEITRINPTASGDFNTALEGVLTIKNHKKPLRILANVVVNNDEVIIASEPTDIKRKDFGIAYEIPLENGILNEDFTLQILLNAKKK